jgi:hypothetical protein
VKGKKNQGRRKENAKLKDCRTTKYTGNTRETYNAITEDSLQAGQEVFQYDIFPAFLPLTS